MNYRKRRILKDQRKRLISSFAVFICLVATLVYLRSRLWVIDLSYKYHQLQNNLQEVKKENSKLKIEVGRLKTPSRIDRIAREELGLRSKDELQPMVHTMQSEDASQIASRK